MMTAVREEFEIARMSEHDLLEVVDIEESSGLSRWGWAKKQGLFKTFCYLTH